MKKRKIIILTLVALALFYPVKKIVTLRDEQRSFAFMGWTLNIKGPLIKRGAFTTGIRHSETEFFANDFNVSFNRIPGLETGKSAGGFITERGGIKIVEQDEKNLLKNFIAEKDLTRLFKEDDDLHGGIKQYFRLSKQEFALLGLKVGDCVYGSFVNITKKIEILRMPCLPDSGNADLNGLGGGYSFDGDTLLLAVGAPEADSTAIRKLAQDMSSPYGKVIRFKKTDLERAQKGKFEIFSLGHRNPQGMSEIDGSVYLVEHGPKGGDEINLIKKANNYGWPVYSLGTSYNERLLYKSAESPGANPKFSSPIFSFVPSIGISDITGCPKIVATRYAPLQCLLVSSLRANSLYIILIERNRQAIASVEKIEFDERIREFVKNSKDETYILTDAGGAYRVSFDMVVK